MYLFKLSQAHIVTLFQNRDISNPLSLTNLDCFRSRDFFYFTYSVGDHNIHCLFHWNMKGRNVISMWLTMQTTTVAKSRAGVLLEKKTRTNENPQDNWGWQKEKTISPSTASLRKESKLPCTYLHVKTKLESYALHGNQESELNSKGNSRVICQSLKPINFRNTDELIFPLWQVDTFYCSPINWTYSLSACSLRTEIWIQLISVKDKCFKAAITSIPLAEFTSSINTSTSYTKKNFYKICAKYSTSQIPNSLKANEDESLGVSHQSQQTVLQYPFKCSYCPFPLVNVLISSKIFH